ncbi:MAG: 30S ribosomal protein S6e [Candidatus Aenigmatarchaeota archaeon]
MFKIVVADPKTRRTYQKEVSPKESALIGRKIGDKVKGDFLGLTGYELEITGGSDKDGFPMRADIPGFGRKRALLSDGPGFRPKKKGERKRKLVRGNTISEDIVQVNMKVVTYGKESLAKLFGKEEVAEEKKEVKGEKKSEGDVKQDESKVSENKKEEKQ